MDSGFLKGNLHFLVVIPLHQWAFDIWVEWGMLLVPPTFVDNFDTMESNLFCNSKESLPWTSWGIWASSSVTFSLLQLLVLVWKYSSEFITILQVVAYILRAFYSIFILFYQFSICSFINFCIIYFNWFQHSEYSWALDANSVICCIKYGSIQQIGYLWLVWQATANGMICNGR